MKKCACIIFTLAFMTLLAGCILSEDLSQLWSSARVDEALRGTWEAADGSPVIRLHFDMGPSHMLCTITSGEPSDPILLPPVRCRTIKDEETNMDFLLFQDFYSLMASHFGENQGAAPDGMGMLVPYRLTEDNRLAIYSHNEPVLSERVDANEVPGGYLREGGNPPSREKQQPFVKKPSPATLRLIATDVVKTNAPLMIFRRGKEGAEGKGVGNGAVQ